MQKINRIVAAVLVFTLTCCGSAIHAQVTLDLSAQERAPIADYSLSLVSGETLKPFDEARTKAMVFIFISTDCPIANAYHPELAKLQSEFQSQGVKLVLVHSNKNTTNDTATKHIADFKIELPVAIDRDQEFAKRLSAKVTPEAFLFKRNDSEPAYRGRIDNLYEGYGKKRSTVTQHFLRDAIEAVLANQPVAIAETQSVGCFIEFGSTESIHHSQNPTIATNAKTPSHDGDYDPSKKLHDSKIIDRELNDAERNRTLPIRWYLPTDDSNPWPIIVLSHGLGGNRKACSYLGEHWSTRGYFVIALQHPGSDEAVWKDKPRLQIRANLNQAASAENLKLRAGDVVFAIDELEKWNQDPKHELFGKLDLKHIGMAGHSFGAVTTQAVAGQKYRGSSVFQDGRITAALPLSPSPPRVGQAKAAFGHIETPWLLITGTQDEAPIGGITAKQRPEVYEALPAGNKYELILEGAQHYAFGNESARGMPMPRNPKHHPAIIAISTAFWDSYLRESKQAKQWLDNDRPRSLLDREDQWLKK